MNVQNPAASRGIAIQAVDLVKNYGAGSNMVHALRGVNVSFERGKFTAIMGPSGSGKSTLMHTLAGLDSATSGHILFGGADLTRMDDKQLTLLRRHKIGFIFQSFNLLPMFTAEQNILMPLTLAGDKPDHAWFDLLVDTLGLKQRLNHRPNELSGGQQQRVAIARALITKPKLVFADEPTGNLDSVSSAEVLGFLKRSVNELGQTIVMVTHDAVAASYADRAHRVRRRTDRGRRGESHCRNDERAAYGRTRTRHAHCRHQHTRRHARPSCRCKGCAQPAHHRRSIAPSWENRHHAPCPRRRPARSLSRKARDRTPPCFPSL